MRRWHTLLAVVAFALAGCSYRRTAWQRHALTLPSTAPRTAGVTCSTSTAAPSADLVGTVLFGAASVGAIYVGADLQAWCDNGGAFGNFCDGEPLAWFLPVAAVFAGIAVIYGFSASHGYATARRCRDQQP